MISILKICFIKHLMKLIVRKIINSDNFYSTPMISISVIIVVKLFFTGASGSYSLYPSYNQMNLKLDLFNNQS